MPTEFGSTAVGVASHCVCFEATCPPCHGKLVQQVKGGGACCGSLPMLTSGKGLRATRALP